MNHPEFHRSEYSACASIQNEAHLDDLLSTPTDAAVKAMARLKGDILLLGAGGKMGPTFATMARRADAAVGVSRRITAVSRFSDESLPNELRESGIDVIRGDLMDDAFLASLPDVENVVSMVGMKFGTGSAASMTWAMNTYLPSQICRKYRSSRIMAFSTGNVYPLVALESGGSQESDVLCPVGEYGMSALGRERIYEHFSRTLGIRLTIIRLNYAVEMRYGVLVDIAQQVLSGNEIDLSMSAANVIWQGDANALSLAALADATTPPFVLNVAGEELFRVQDVAERFAERFGVVARFRGSPGTTALLNNGRLARNRYGGSRVSLDQLITWTADWLQRGGRLLSKPTQFQNRDGRF